MKQFLLFVTLDALPLNYDFFVIIIITEMFEFIISVSGWLEYFNNKEEEEICKKLTEC